MYFVPLVIEDKAIGIITIQNRADHAYNEQSLKTLETLVAYVAIAIRNTQKNNALKVEIEEKNLIQDELAKLNKELQDLSEIDGLTGIANRRHFDEPPWCGAGAIFEVQIRNFRKKITSLPLPIFNLIWRDLRLAFIAFEPAIDFRNECAHCEGEMTRFRKSE